VVHHAATCRGHAAPQLRDLARLMDWTFTLL